VPAISQRTLAYQVALQQDAITNKQLVQASEMRFTTLGALLQWISSMHLPGMKPYLMEAAFGMYSLFTAQLLRRGDMNAAFLFAKRFAPYFVHAHSAEIDALFEAVTVAVQSGKDAAMQCKAVQLWFGSSTGVVIRMPQAVLQTLNRYIGRPECALLREVSQHALVFRTLGPKHALQPPAAQLARVEENEAPAVPLPTDALLAAQVPPTHADKLRAVNALGPVWWASFHEAALLAHVLENNEASLAPDVIARLREALAALPTVASPVPSVSLLFARAGGQGVHQQLNAAFVPTMALMAGSALNNVALPGCRAFFNNGASTADLRGLAVNGESKVRAAHGNSTTLQAVKHVADCEAAAARGNPRPQLDSHLFSLLFSASVQCVKSMTMSATKLHAQGLPPSAAVELMHQAAFTSRPDLKELAVGHGVGWYVAAVAQAGVPCVPPAVLAPITQAWTLLRGSVSRAFETSSDVADAELSVAVTRAQGVAEGLHMWAAATGQLVHLPWLLAPLAADASGRTEVALATPGNRGKRVLKLPPHAATQTDLARMALAQAMSRAPHAALSDAVVRDVFSRLLLGRAGAGGTPDATPALPSIVSYTYVPGSTDGPGRSVTCMAVSPGECGGRDGGTTSITGRTDGTVQLRMYAAAADTPQSDAGNNTPHTQAAVAATGIGHAAAVTAVAVAPGGEAALSCDAEGTLLLWATGRAAAAAAMATAKGTAGDASPAVHPVCAYHCAAGVGGGLGAPATPWCAAWNPAVHSLFATGGRGGLVRVWGTHRVTPLRELLGHTEDVTSLAWLPNGMYLVSGSADGTLRLWDVATGDCMRVMVPGVTPAVQDGQAGIVASAAVAALAVSPCGQWVAALYACGALRIWHSDACVAITTVPYAHVSSPATSVVFSVCGNMLVTSEQNGTLRAWEMSELLVSNTPAGAAAYSSAAAPATAVDAAPRKEVSLHAAQNGTVGTVYSMGGVHPLATWRAGSITPHALVFTPRNLLICAGSASHS